MLKEAGMDVMPVPTPREIDLSCGLSLLFRSGDQNRIGAVLRQEKVIWVKLYSKVIPGPVYEKLSEYGEAE